MVELRIVHGLLQYRNKFGPSGAIAEGGGVWGPWVSVPYVTREEAALSDAKDAGGGRPCDTEEGR